MLVQTIRSGVGQRVRTALTLLVLGSLLSGCFRPPPPAPVPFPDDSRVLNGPWNLTVMGLSGGPARFVHAERANRIVLWKGGQVRVYALQDTTGWEEQPAGALSDAVANTFDPAIEAFVTITAGEGSIGIRVVPADGAPAVTHNVAVPAGHSLEEVASGSGLVFALTRVAGGAWHLTWWHSASGALGGTRVVPAPRDGFRVSSNGRTLALWNLDAWRVTVIDTEAPHAQVDVRLGACRSNFLSESSADGRWFLVADCGSNVRAADLTEESPTTTAVGVRYTSLITFAAHGGEFVWRDASGVMHAYDLTERTREELARLEVEPLEHLEPWVRAVYLNRNAGLLVYGTNHGTVRTESLPPGTDAAVEEELPRLALSGALLDLRAGPLSTNEAGGTSASSYEFSGSFQAVGASVADEALAITGTVSAYGLHDYKPGLTPQVWIPMLTGRAVALDTGTDAERYELTFSTEDRRATVYTGELRDVSEGISYSVRLKRAAVEP
jgi:hypothetical protein